MPDTLNWIIGAAVILLIAVVGIFLKKKSGPSIPEALRPGKSLPDFAAADERGNPVRSALLRCFTWFPMLYLFRHMRAALVRSSL